MGLLGGNGTNFEPEFTSLTPGLFGVHDTIEEVNYFFVELVDD